MPLHHGIVSIFWDIISMISFQNIPRVISSQVLIIWSKLTVLQMLLFLSHCIIWRCHNYYYFEGEKNEKAVLLLSHCFNLTIFILGFCTTRFWFCFFGFFSTICCFCQFFTRYYVVILTYCLIVFDLTYYLVIILFQIFFYHLFYFWSFFCYFDLFHYFKISHYFHLLSLTICFST